jgi:hypothetical protein
MAIILLIVTCKSRTDVQAASQCVAEAHHFNAISAPGKNSDAVPAPFLQYISQTF